MSKDTNVDFVVTLQKGQLAELENTMFDNGCSGVEKMFKLYTTSTTTNMHLFDAQDKLRKFASVNAIIDAYYVTRLEMYKTRKEFLVQAIQQELVLLSNKARYIQETLDNNIDLRRKTKTEVSAMLNGRGYTVIDQDDEFKYLVKMPMDSVTDENVARLNKEHGDKLSELNRIQGQSVENMWQTELAQLETEYIKYKEERMRALAGLPQKTVAVKKVAKLKITTGVTPSSA